MRAAALTGGGSDRFTGSVGARSATTSRGGGSITFGFRGSMAIGFVVAKSSSSLKLAALAFVRR